MSGQSAERDETGVLPCCLGNGRCQAPSAGIGPCGPLPKAESDARIEPLTDRIYAQRDLLPSHIRNPRGHAFHRDDAEVIARAILASDWLRETGVIPPAVTEAER